jgi:hypothetical protein
MIDAQAIPQSSFVRRSRVLDAKEFRDAVAALPSIKAGKALRVTLSPETLAVTKNAAFAFKRHLTEHIKEAKLKPEVAIRKGMASRLSTFPARPASRIENEIRPRSDSEHTRRIGRSERGWRKPSLFSFASPFR